MACSRVPGSAKVLGKAGGQHIYYSAASPPRALSSVFIYSEVWRSLLILSLSFLKLIFFPLTDISKILSDVFPRTHDTHVWKPEANTERLPHLRSTLVLDIGSPTEPRVCSFG